MHYFSWIFGNVILLMLLTISVIINISAQQSCTPSNTIEEFRERENKKINAQNSTGSNTIECKRDYFLFHRDDHVCEVFNLGITKNDNNITIKGNQITTILHIFSVQLYAIPSELFEKFTNLKNLIANGIQIEVIEESSFDKADNLEILRLSNNKIKELSHGTFQNMRKLKTLDLSRNKIEYIHPQAFYGTDSLERLYLSENNIQKLPLTVFETLEKLSFLSLETNHIEEIDVRMFHSNKLIKSLGLSNNSIKELPHELFVNFENLTDLSVSDLRIDSLDLNGTEITTLVIRNTNLRNLTLSNFPKILVLNNSPIELFQIIMNHENEFHRLPNYNGMWFDKSIRFILYVKSVFVKTETLELYDGVVRTHIFLPEFDYQTKNGTHYKAVEYIPRT